MEQVIGYEISAAAIEELIVRGDEPKDMSREVREGDWVTIPSHAQSTAWDAGHVTGVQGDNLYIGYGGRNTPSYNWLYGMRPRIPVQRNEVGEVWRKRSVVRRSSFEFEGKIVPVTSLEYEWYHVR